MINVYLYFTHADLNNIECIWFIVSAVLRVFSSLRSETAVRLEGGKRDVAESGTTRPSQCVFAQASARGITKGPLFWQKHTHSQLHYWLSKFGPDYSSVVSPFLCCSHLGKLAPRLSRCPLVFFSHLSPLISTFPALHSSRLSLLCWLNYSWQFIVPNGQCTADTEGFISLGPCVCVCACVCAWTGYVWLSGWLG